MPDVTSPGPSGAAAGGAPGGQGGEANRDLGRLGEYELLAKLGEGGMGTVYKARQTRLDKIVALKVLPKQYTADPHARTRFEREMKAIGHVSHVNIVQAHDARDIEGTTVLVMEYADGLDLGEVVGRRGPLPVADACELVRQAALGLQAIYENGLVHRDIKPSNIMLTRRGQVKILDLGLALLGSEQTAPAELTSTGQIMGTADYMAPEQAFDSHHVDIRADIYSLGCTLYKLLTAHAPYSGSQYDNPMKKMLAHLQGPLPSLSPLRDDVPAELTAVLSRLLAKAPADRFATPADVAAAMAPFSAGCHLADLLADGPAAPHSARSQATEPHASSAMTGTDPARMPLGERAGSSELPVVGSQLPAVSSQPGGTGVSPVLAAPAAGATGSASASAQALAEPVAHTQGRWRRPAVLVALALAAAAVFAGVIIIRIRDKQGHERTIEVADDAQISIERREGGEKEVGSGERRVSGVGSREKGVASREGVEREGGTSVPPVVGQGATGLRQCRWRAARSVAAETSAATATTERGPAASRPLVLMRNGKPAGEFKTFAGLWDMCQPGDEIVVRGDGPFVLPPLEIRDRALVLKAAPGRHPTFVPDRQLFNLINRGWIDLRRGSLTIEGCDFRMICPAYRGPVPLLSGEAGGPCVLRNCRILGFDGLRDWHGACLA